jgi:hypothetical protein
VATTPRTLTVPADAPAPLGAGRQAINGIEYSVLDEGQARTLLQIDARRRRGQADAPADNERLQETIVGTDALLANNDTAYLAFAGDADNTLALDGGQIVLPHEKYLVLNDHGRLTIVHAGAMQFWTDPVLDRPVAQVPQDMDVPRVGQLVKFEKSLVEPNDPHYLEVTYIGKGDTK